MRFFKSRTIKLSLKLLVSMGFLAWVVFKVDWLEVLNNIKQISLVGVFFYILILLSGMAISSSKWRMLARFKKFDVTTFECFQYYFIGSFINNFMPSFIGGDTYRAYSLGKQQKQYAAAASTVVADRLTGLFGAMLAAFVFGLLDWRSTFSHSVLVILLIGIAGGFIFLFILEKSFKFAFWKKISAKIPAKILNFLKILHEFYSHKKLFTKAVMLGVLFSLVGIGLLNYIVFLSLGINVAILDYLSVIFLISIVSSLPVSIGNIGIQEWAYVTFFGFFGVSATSVITVSILIRILQMIVSFFALPMYLKNRV